MTEYTRIRVSREGPIGELILCTPDDGNRFDHVTHVEIVDALRTFSADKSLRAIVFGADGKVFSAGGDFQLMLNNHANPETRVDMGLEAAELLEAFAHAAVPIVCGVQGHAVGVGATMALSSDIVVCSRNATLSDPHVAVGLTPGDGGVVLWPQNAGLMVAKRFLLTGDRISAEDARMLGLITDIVDQPDEVLPAARALATRIASLPPFAVRSTKRSLNQIFRRNIETNLHLSTAYEMACFGTTDMVEAINAFREKRRPNFTGV